MSADNDKLTPTSKTGQARAEGLGLRSSVATDPLWEKSAREAVPAAALLPYQVDWVNDTAPVKLIEKSRRIGLSWAEAAAAALDAAKTTGRDWYYVGYNQDMAREFCEDVGNWARSYNLAAGTIEQFDTEDQDESGIIRKILTFRVVFASGNKVVALSSRPSNLRGKQGVIVLDELAFHPEPGQLLKAALAMLIWGGEVHIISTHDGDENPFNELVNEIRAGKRNYSLHRVTFDQAVAEGLYRRVCLRLHRQWTAAGEAAWVAGIYDFYGSEADEELRVIPAHGSGAFLSRALIEAASSAEIPVLQFTCDADFVFQPATIRAAEALGFCAEAILPLISGLDVNRPTFFSGDFGRTGDLSYRLAWQESGNAHRALFALELRNVPFEQQVQIDTFILERLPRFRGGAYDARGNGQAHAEAMAQKFGASRIHQVMLSVPWYRENMPAMKAAFEDRTVAIPADPDLVDDLRAFRMEKGVAQLPENYRGKGRDGGQRHGDGGIAVALGVFAIRNCDAGPLEYLAVGDGRRWARADNRNDNDGRMRERPNQRSASDRRRGAW
jgi:phage FluMu gp28-like protein